MYFYSPFPTFLSPSPVSSRTALIGFGEPPQETFSPMVIAILAVGLGTPVVLLAGGMIVALALRRRQHSEYEPIN